MRGCMRFCLYLYMHALRVHVFFLPVYVYAWKKKIHVTDLNRNFARLLLLPMRFFVCLFDVMLPCCIDSTLPRRRSSATHGVRIFVFVFVFVFTSTCIRQTHTHTHTRARRNRIEMARLLVLPTCFPEHTHAQMLTVSIWIGMACCRFCQNASLNTQMLNVSETFYLVQKWKMYVDARMSARFVCMRICMCCVRACMCVSSICAIRKQVWRRFS